MAVTRRDGGFTLIELLVVLAILGLAYGLVPPMFSGAHATAELKGAARQVAAGLRKARNQAVTQRSEAEFTVDVEKRSFQVSGDQRTYQLPKNVDLSLAADISSTASDKIDSIRFYQDGSSDGGHVTLAAEDRKFTVEINWLTGRVAIVE